MKTNKLLDSIYEKNAIAEGWSIETYRYNQQVTESIKTLANEIENRPYDEWPKFDINWDLRPESFCYSVDCTSPIRFNTSYPDIILGWVSCDELHKILHSYNKREPHELWELGSSNKLARVIAYASKGHPLTPLMVKPHPICNGELCLEGGNHRYAMVNTLGLDRMPILANLTHKIRLSELLDICWL